jgi:hypothetical protein
MLCELIVHGLVKEGVLSLQASKYVSDVLMVSCQRQVAVFCFTLPKLQIAEMANSKWNKESGLGICLKTVFSSRAISVSFQVCCKPPMGGLQSGQSLFHVGRLLRF